MKLTELPVLFLDLQTTGARPENSHVIEIAWAAWGESSIQSYLAPLPEPESIPRRIEILTGIRNEDLVEALPLAQTLEKLKIECASSRPAPVAVIHFARFEKPFLEELYASHPEGLPFEIICTHEIAKRLMPNLPSRGIKGLAGYFGYNAGELKRGASHVEATQFIWKGLLQALEKENIFTLAELQSWLKEKPKSVRKKYEYPLTKEKRLQLPDQPGVYRMLSQWGEILYVGKATSLFNRVNSYFRGQKNRDPRKLEMLTQTWDLQVTLCESPLEAALLETDEIKRLNPRYNINLKTGQRRLIFFNRDFTEFSEGQSEVFHIGPFPNLMIFDSMMKLSHSLQENEFDPLMFFEPVEPELLREGFELFCQRSNFEPQVFTSLRSILAVGLWWQRQYEIIESESEVEGETEISEDQPQTAEDIADRFERHFIRTGQAYAKARQLTRLLNADVGFKLAQTDSQRTLAIREGRIQQSCLAENIRSVEKDCSWQGLSIDTYDRMSILLSELEKIKNQQGSVQVSYLERRGI